MAAPAGPGAREKATGIGIGIDLGECLTKLAVTGPHPWAGSAATDVQSSTIALDRLLRTADVSGGRAALAVRAEPEDERVPKLVEILKSRFDFEVLEPIDSHVAVLADLVAGGDPGDPDITYLICDVGSRTISAAFCSARDTRLRLITGHRVPEQQPSPTELLEQTLAERALGSSDIRARERVRAEVGNRHERARLVLDRMSRQERYGQTPVLFPTVAEGARRIVGVDFTLALTPLVETVGSLVQTLVRECYEPLPIVHVLPTGGLGQLRPVWSAMQDALPPTSRIVVRPTPLTSAARGAATLATGRMTIDRAAHHSLRLRAHHLHRGLLATVDIPLTRAGEPPPGWLTAGDAPFTVTVDEHPTGPLLEVSERGTGPWLPLRWTAAEVPPGGYQVGHFTGRGPLGVLVLRDLSDGSTISIPLGDPNDVDQRVR